MNIIQTWKTKDIPVRYEKLIQSVINHNPKWNYLFFSDEDIKEFIDNKKNGKILYIKFQRQNLGPIRNDVNVTYDLSSHDISILIFLFNSKIMSCYNFFS